MTDLDLDAIKKQHAMDLELGRWSDSTEPLLAEVERLTAENKRLLGERQNQAENAAEERAVRQNMSRRIDALQARIDAALALCDQAEAQALRLGYLNLFGEPRPAILLVVDLRAALTGDTP